MSQASLSPLLQDCRCREDAAAYIGVKVSTLAGYAHSGKYRDELPYAMIGKKAYYRTVDLDRFIESRFSSSGQK